MAEMKDSGIEWIGMIPKNWNADKIKYHLKRNEPKNPGNVEVLSVYREYGVIPKNSRDDNHNITSEDTSKYKYVKKGDLVINKMKAWQGSMGVSEYEGIVSPAYFIYNFTDNYLDKKYFHFLIRNCYKDEFRRISGGIREGQWDLSADLFADELVLVPPIKEQIKIVEFLNTKCAEIDTLYSDIEKQIETLEEYKKTTITEAVTKGLDPDVEMKNSGIEWIGEIPQKWECKKVKYLCKTRNEKYDITHGRLNYFALENLVSWNMKYIETENEYDVSGTNLCYKNDVVFGKLRPYLAKTFLVDYDRCCSTEFAVFHSFQGLPKYYLYVFTTQGFVKTVDDSTLGVKMPRANIEFIKNVFIPVAPKSEQQQIVDYLDSKCTEIDGIIFDKKKQLETLEQYKKSLIYEYVTGKKEVK
jgi:hypothetical protein